MDVFLKFNTSAPLDGLDKDSFFYFGEPGRLSEAGVCGCCGARWHNIDNPHQTQKGLSFYLCDNKNPRHVETKKALLSNRWKNDFENGYVVTHTEVPLDDQFSLIVGETFQ